MKNQFMRAEEVARELEVSRSYAYRLIRQLNAELREKGYMTIAGRVNRQYFQERLYYNLRENPCAKAGSIGKNKADEMSFWTKEEFQRFADRIMDKQASYAILGQL